MSSEDVAQHYNAIPNSGVQARMDSKIYHMRNFNNWMKSMLISEFLDRLKNDGCLDVRVLDMCCGKGGDLLKWRMGGIREVLMTDIAEVSLDHARERYADISGKMRREQQDPFKATFLPADACVCRLADKYEPNREFDLTSCQFSLHYSFSEEEKAFRFLKNATERIRPGGYFIGTLPDACQIVHLLRTKGKDNCYENEVCRVEYTDKSKDLKEVQPPLFGAKIHFALGEVVDCPEYLAYFPLVEKMLNGLGMDLVCEERFRDAYMRYIGNSCGEGKMLLQKMNVFKRCSLRDRSNGGHDEEYQHATEYMENRLSGDGNEQGTLSKSEWEVASMYMIFAFKKRKPGTSDPALQKKDSSDPDSST